MSVKLGLTLSVSPRSLPEMSPEEEAVRKEYDDLIQQEEKVEDTLFDVARKFPQRNRYVNILPNEPTRFKIPDEPGFYFNANWVLGKKAIACQGPKSDEIFEFWRMAWKAKAAAIVMLTNLVENVEKCSSYWPALDQVLKFKKMNITTIKEVALFQNGDEQIVRRDFKIVKDGKQRSISQFQLENWPDHGLVKAATLAQLIRFVMDHGKEPLIVHCSAGISRTGAFLTAYGAFKQKIDSLSDVLKNLRDPYKGRAGLVQSPAHYLLAHQALQILKPS